MVSRTRLYIGQWPPPPGSFRPRSFAVWVRIIFVISVFAARTRGAGLVCENERCSQEFSVREDVPENSEVGIVGTSSSTGPLPFTDFFSTSTSSNATRVFDVAFSTGRITTRSKLDRETVPNGYIFVVGTSNIPVVVTVNLLDINDNSPMFTPSSRNLEFSESAPFGAKKSLGSVNDPDLGNNSTQTCEIVSGNIGNAFSLQKMTSGNFDIILDLTVNMQLDYEQVSSYTLILRATDGGGRTGEMTVRITILDQNDNQPIFNTSKYDVRIAENVTVGTSIIQVEATDQDSGPNGLIRYSIESKTDPEARFRIDPATGVVSVNKPLDYETQSTFRLTLEATDDGPHKLVGNAALDVTLENINEQPADIQLVYLQGADRQGHIPENTQAGTPVARISIDDPDITEDRHVDVNVTLLGGDKVFGLEITDDVLSLVVVNTPPDRENKSVYDLTIIVTDAGNPPLRASESFKVYIDDVNDNAPEFTQNPYHGEVQETAEVGTSVLTVTAIDADEGDNAKIYFAILAGSSPQSGWFDIDSSTGVITTRTPIDCELNSQPELVVTARDNGELPLSGSTTVVIAVRDVNDKQPEFETSFYNAKVGEDAAIGHCPIEVHATDPECGASAPVTYQMVRNGDAPPEFTIGEGDGRICIQQPGLDFERNSSYQFLVQAVDRDGLSASAVVQITVTDVNDNSPYFEPQQYALNVEATVAQGPLLTVQGADLDSGDFGTVSYSFVNDNGNDYFQIDAGSGTISLIRSFSAGTNRMYQLRVQGTDKGGRVSEQPAQVEVSVYSGVVHPPAFTLTMYNFTVVEDTPLDVLVGQVEATVAASSSSSSSSGIHYSIVYSTRSWFRIDQTTGNIYTSGQLDREANQFILLGLRAQTTEPQVLYSTAQVNITLLDVNDNAPHFPASSVLRIEVREDTLLPDPVYIAQATDIDSGNNGSVTYRLDFLPDHLFQIDEHTGEIFLRAMLDYEVRHAYELTVVAEDQGTGGHRSSSMTLTVNVKDVNDNRPVFSRDVYDFYVSEDSPIGFQFGNVSAEDADSDHNGRVSYSLEASPYLSVFGIFTVQGVLSTRDKLDRESQDLYTLTVVATDHGTPDPLSATADIRVHVTDTNDNDPEFTRAGYKFSILENQPRGSHIGQVTASDRDAGDNRRLQYQFNGPQSKFAINTYNGEITTLEPLDREEQDEYSLKVFVTDSGVPERSDSAVVKIGVLDENDNRPQFLGGEGGYRTVVSENRPKGLQVMKMVAQDRDAGENGTVTFAFDPDESDPEALVNFNIHPTSGWISTEEVLDYETRTQYRLQVLAYDNGNPRRFQSQTVTIEVADVNDEAPLFHAREVNFYVVENVAIGTVVGEVQAQDRDSGENGRVNYYLVGGNVFSLFSVHTATGVIRTVREIDYEESSSHVLSIQAVDSNAAFPRSSNISVIVHIVDLNDNAPVFDNDPVFPKVRENAALGHVVHTFVATDRDSGLNGTVRYSVASESAAGPDVTPGHYFQIDAGTGELSVAKSIDYEQVHTVTIIIKAEDSCPVPSKVLFSQVTVEVSVVDVNDNRPVFESRSEVHIFEDEPIGYPAIFIVAVDRDSNQEDSGNNVVNYGIVSGNEDGKFRLEQSSGLLTIYEALDRETRSNYSLNVSAEDAGVPKKVAFQQLRVSVVDVNDNAPLFQQSLYQGRVYESAPSDSRPVSTPVATVKATDSDEGNNGNLTYMILRGIAGDKFAVDPITGVVTAIKPLDREEQDMYTVTVYVKDDGYPSLFDITTVLVEVLDVNDHSPVFEKDLYRLHVPENQPQPSVITIAASDRDVGLNAEIVYTISDGDDDGKFDIDRNTGELSCQALDREARETYTLTITGTDSGTPRRSGSTRVTVTVLDDNDNSPSFSHGTYTATIPEDIAKGHTVMQVYASDPDQGSNGQVAYSLLGNDTEGYFSVNSTSGDIITSGTFDREKNASFDFLLVASDGGGSGPRNSTARIRVIISDVNDNAPVFRQVPYKTTSPQTTGQGQTVLQMLADDPDAGSNGTVRYELLDSTESYTRAFFQVDRHSGQVTTRQALSQAALGYHSLLVVATDQGSPALSTTGVAEITVGDSGSAPQLTFDQEQYVKEIAENSPVDTTVATVGVSPYSGSGAVTYSFANGNFHNTFKINSQTGLVQVADPTLLDYESTPQMDLIVAAVAGGHHAYAKLQVNLLDENDNKPKFAQTKYVSAIWENNKPQTFVTQVWAKDADSGRNGMIDYTIIKGNTDNVFEIVPSHTGIIRTNIDVPRLDREIKSSYTLVIEAQDYGFPYQSSTCSLHITIVDENDNPPKFPSPGPGPVRVPENKQAGYVVAVVTATDVDLNPVLVYDFTSQGNPDSAFSIDRSSGTILLATSLDHETRAHYTLGLQVTDGQHTVSTTLVVEVADVNDNAPRFTRQSYQAALPENTPAGKSVLTVMATDADDGDNAAVTYSLGEASLASFSVDPHTGTIFTNQSMLSSSAESVVQLVVVAGDGGSPPLSTMVAVQIQITDINNYSPQFLRSNYTAQVKESLQKGTEVLQVSAVDRDYSHRNDNVHYVLSGPSAATFYIQTSTGRILLNGPLDHELTRRYDLTVMAVDRGTPPRNATVPITIHVLDENDSPPVFHRQHFFVSLRENFPLQQIFLTVNATDADEGAYADLEYSITSGNSDGLFYNYKSGGLFVLTPLDYEARQSHRLIVRAMDCASCREGVPRLSAFVTVDVNVTDVNEFDPQFPVSHYYQTVPENVMDWLIFQVHANDQDGGEYGVVTYTILPGGDQELFAINSKTGDVTTKTVFDYEDPLERKVYTITVQASDPDQRRDNVSVTIRVTDEDEYSPVFTNTTYSFSVPGSAKAGAYVGTVAATDRDAGAAGRLVYTFDHLTDYFQIHPVTGNITVSHTLHEDIPEEGSDSGSLRARRKKRALQKDTETPIVHASSGMENSRWAKAFVKINIDRTCAGCQATKLVDKSGLSSVAIAMIVLVCILVPTIIVVFMLVFICRRRNRKGEQSGLDGRAAYGGSRRETQGVASSPPLEDAGNPPAYKDVLQQFSSHNHGGHGHPANITSSDLSEQSNKSASSGRGSAEVEDEDEEIRMINDSSYLTNAAGYRHKTMPDSGIQQDDDTLSEPSATNHQEYLARLGIDSSKIGKSSGKGGSSKGSTTTGDIAFSVESMHQFSDEGGGEGGVDLDRLTDTDVDEEMVMIENSRQHHQQLQAMNMLPASGGGGGVVGGLSFQPPEPQQAGALSNVVNSEEEYSGSYNWDYLLDWGPQYQPLAHVFAEIAKLKDESVTPKKTPVKTVPQRRISGGQGLVSVSQARIVPPPIITNAPPLVALDSGGDDGGSRAGSERGGRHKVGSRGGGGHSHKSSASSSSAGSRSHSQRTSAMNSSLPSLPRSPISYESSYTSPALTPSFTPSLSPLGAHTPSSISPAVSGHTSGHASTHSGHHPHSNAHHPHPHHAPGKPVSSNHHHHYHEPQFQRQHSPHNNNSHSRAAALHNTTANHNNSHNNNVRLTLSASSDSEREFRI